MEYRRKLELPLQKRRGIDKVKGKPECTKELISLAGESGFAMRYGFMGLTFGFAFWGRLGQGLGLHFAIYQELYFLRANVLSGNKLAVRRGSGEVWLAIMVMHNSQVSSVRCRTPEYVEILILASVFGITATVYRRL